MTGSLTFVLQRVPLRVKSADHIDGVLSRQGKLNLAAGDDIQRKDPVIQFRAFPFFMAHQPLQHLQRRALIEHVHRVSVPKNMRRYQHDKMNALAVGLPFGFREPIAYRAIGGLPNRQGVTLTRLYIDLKLFLGTGKQPAQFVDKVRIGKGDKPICLFTFCRTAGATASLFGGTQNDMGHLHGEPDVSPLERKGFIDPGTGVLQQIDERMLWPVRQIVKQGSHFRCQQIARQRMLIIPRVQQRDFLASRCAGGGQYPR
ncbi:hypothetical protein [Enterobacter mori]